MGKTWDELKFGWSLAVDFRDRSPRAPQVFGGGGAPELSAPLVRNPLFFIIFRWSLIHTKQRHSFES